MGLLDEAIRDHLELKRRQGADPNDLARAEHEALEPVFPDEQRLEHPVQDEDADDEPLAPGHEELRHEDVGQETAEMDVQAFLDAETAMTDVEQPPAQIPGQERLTFE